MGLKIRAPGNRVTRLFPELIGHAAQLSATRNILSSNYALNVELRAHRRFALSGTRRNLRQAQGIMCVNCPGELKEITPAQTHMSLELLLSAGAPQSSTVGAPGTQGAGVTGIQGIGVSTPSAAAVAATTMGFAGDLQTPKGMMFTIGMLSRMFAATMLLVITGLGVGINGLGVAPIEQVIIAPIQVCIAIAVPPLGYSASSCLRHHLPRPRWP